jgi:hypothetical protein
MSPCLAAFVEAPAIRSKSALNRQYIDAPRPAMLRLMDTEGHWFAGFERRDFELGGVRIHARTGRRPLHTRGIAGSDGRSAAGFFGD